MKQIYAEFVDKKYPELRSLIKDNFTTQEKFADVLGISAISLNKKLNGHVPFKQKEIDKSRAVFKLSPDDVVRIFFTA